MRKTPFAGALAAAVAATLEPGAGLGAQQPSLPEFEGQVVVREVLLDVLVTDAGGNVVVGLGAEDFVVEEDGEPVAVESVSFYSNRRLLGDFGGAAPATAPDDPPADRFFVLFYAWPPLLDGRNRDHLLHLPEAGRRSFEWVVEELLPSDHVAVVSYDTGLRFHHDFTRDRTRLGEAIRRASTGRAPKQRWASRTEVPIEAISLAALAADPELRRSTEDVFEALELLATVLGEIPGRKNLVLFGPDLPAEGSPDWYRGYPSAVEALNTHNVAAYTIGVSRRGRQPSLLRLAEDTGGEYAYRFDSFLSPLREIAQENSGYYLLSYRSGHPAGESGYREVTVRTANPEFQVRSRSGYRYGG